MQPNNDVLKRHNRPLNQTINPQNAVWRRRPGQYLDTESIMDYLRAWSFKRRPIRENRQLNLGMQMGEFLPRTRDVALSLAVWSPPAMNSAKSVCKKVKRLEYSPNPSYNMNKSEQLNDYLF